ncbi:28S ribosomal protein S18c, mitochondrial, partial [Lingula anatina]|uniref:28S ribosomal protein S18c, mitochondrial n=1 Tax=Lingula anatina TaxID=7574 RepID=A0A1S3IJ51_LINAN
MATSILKKAFPNLRYVWRTYFNVNATKVVNIDVSKSLRSIGSANFTTSARLQKDFIHDEDEFSGKQDEATDADIHDLQSKDDGGFSREKLIRAFQAQERRAAKILREQKSDKPFRQMSNPYKKKRRKCYLCEYDVKLDYKNTQLLNQFISPHTGRIYSSKITGLCIPMQKRIVVQIKRARRFGFMPTLHREVTYIGDAVPYKDPYFKPSSESSN